MSLFLIGVVVFAVGTTGYAWGLRERMKSDPTLQGKGLKALFKKR